MRLETSGHPVLRLTMRIDGLGAEFFRWEFATAVAGAVLGINPFDEPNVAEAKDQTETPCSQHMPRKACCLNRPPRQERCGERVERDFSGTSPAG